MQINPQETADLLNCFYAKFLVSYIILADFTPPISASIWNKVIKLRVKGKLHLSYSVTSKLRNFSFVESSFFTETK